MKNTEYLINLRADKRLCLIEYLIKQKDKSLDQSRAAILSRAIAVSYTHLTLPTN
ncbi:hypothetical protein [uncultured Ruminococcus sp.]|uniref:hypothetical protein n=1 Tax=uncultured Ruminococcus sp. TaxID=165186 RepID=UPI0025D6559B|nr:hypothetical protein [uncultured Ruminococcus sp.]